MQKKIRDFCNKSQFFKGKKAKKKEEILTIILLKHMPERLYNTEKSLITLFLTFYDA